MPVQNYEHISPGAECLGIFDFMLYVLLKQQIPCWPLMDSSFSIPLKVNHQSWGRFFTPTRVLGLTLVVATECAARIRRAIDQYDFAPPDKMHADTAFAFYSSLLCVQNMTRQRCSCLCLVIVRLNQL